MNEERNNGSFFSLNNLKKSKLVKLLAGIGVLMLVLICGCNLVKALPGFLLKQGDPTNLIPQEVVDHWNAVVKDEIKASNWYLTIESDTNEGYMSIKTQYPLAKECFTNSDQVLKDAIAGRFDTNAGSATNKPSGQVNASAFTPVLIQNLPADLITKCQQMEQDLAKSISSWRQARANDFGELWQIKSDYDGLVRGDLRSSLRLDLAKYALQQFQDHGITIPKNYVYPTFNLTAISKDRTICDYYGSKDANIEWNPALGQCTLESKAAYDYIFRPITSASVQNSFDCGVDNLDPLAPTPTPGGTPCAKN